MPAAGVLPNGYPKYGTSCLVFSLLIAHDNRVTVYNRSEMLWNCNLRVQCNGTSAGNEAKALPSECDLVTSYYAPCKCSYDALTSLYLRMT